MAINARLLSRALPEGEWTRRTV